MVNGLHFYSAFSTLAALKVLHNFCLSFTLTHTAYELPCKAPACPSGAIYNVA